MLDEAWVVGEEEEKRARRKAEGLDRERQRRRRKRREAVGGKGKGKGKSAGAEKEKRRGREDGHGGLKGEVSRSKRQVDGEDRDRRPDAHKAKKNNL